MSGISFNFLGDVKPTDKINSPFFLGLIITLIILFVFYWNVNREFKKTTDRVYVYGILAVCTYATSVLALLAHYNILEHSFEVKSGSYANKLDVERASQIQTANLSPNFTVVSSMPQIQPSNNFSPMPPQNPLN
jgi:hypothetical protein